MLLTAADRHACPFSLAELKVCVPPVLVVGYVQLLAKECTHESKDSENAMNGKWSAFRWQPSSQKAFHVKEFAEKSWIRVFWEIHGVEALGQYPSQ